MSRVFPHHLPDAQALSRAGGATLIELMVVLVVLAVAAGMVSLSIAPTSGQVLERAAHELAGSLEEARWLAVSKGGRVVWQEPGRLDVLNEASTRASPAGLPRPQWLWQAADGSWQRADPSHDLPWPNGVRVVIATGANPTRAEGPARILLGPEAAGHAVCILLTQAGQSLSVASDGLAPFVVRQQAC